MELLLGSIEQGLIFGILALGVYLTFRVLNFPDLTVDGSFPLGEPWRRRSSSRGFARVGDRRGFFAGVLAGLATALMNTKGGVHGLLAGILTMTGLYSINLRIMGTANVSLLRKDTLFTPVEELSGWMRHAALVGVLLLAVLVVKFLLDAFLRTDLGLSLRASGTIREWLRASGSTLTGPSSSASPWRTASSRSAERSWRSFKVMPTSRWGSA